MPTYEFRCPEGHEFEKFYRSIAASPVEVRCPTCGKLAERQLSGAGLVFKGTGFYITDYGKDGKKSQTAAPVTAEGGAPATGAESVGSKGDSSASGDSKPATEAKSSGETKPAPLAKPAAKDAPAKSSKNSE